MGELETKNVIRYKLHVPMYGLTAKNRHILLPSAWPSDLPFAIKACICRGVPNVYGGPQSSVTTYSHDFNRIPVNVQ